MAEMGTPPGPLLDRDGNYTRTPEPETPINLSMRFNKRQQRAIDIQAPPRLAPSEAPAAQNTGKNFSTSTDHGLTGLISQHLDKMQKATDTRNNIITAVTKAIDTCTKGYKSPDEAKVATLLQQHLLKALKDFLQPLENATRQRTSTYSGKTTPALHTWAEVARAAKGPSLKETVTSKNTKQSNSPAQKEDFRLLITVPAETRLRQITPYAIRQAICAATGLDSRDIPHANATKTGWAISPANKKTRDLLLEQENQKRMIQAVNGTSARIPEKWINYAVQGVQSAYQTVGGEQVLITATKVQEEAHTQTRVQPVSCRPSRHGADEHGNTTWIVSFLKPVRAFQLFNTSERSKLIQKYPAIQRHRLGCQGFCNPAKCIRAPRCSNCGAKTADHEGPTGEGCKHKPHCANCYGPHKADHKSCPAIPQRKSGKLIRLTKRELNIVRRAGELAYQQTNSDKETPSDIGPISSTSMPPQATEVRPAPTQTHNSSQKRNRSSEDTTSKEALASTHAQEQPTVRPTRAATNRQSLNLRQLSANSVRIELSSTPPSESGDTDMSDTPSSC